MTKNRGIYYTTAKTYDFAMKELYEPNIGKTLMTPTFDSKTIFNQTSKKERI